MNFVRSSKGSDFLDIIDAGVKTMVEFGTNDMMPHFIYGGLTPWLSDNFRRIILKKMREYGIQSFILTTIYMYRERLITKEKAKKAAEGKLKNAPLWRLYKGSINDDLDSFINNLQNSNEVKDEDVRSFFLPKLTKEKLQLVEEKNKEHMMTYWFNVNADVGVEEMKKSDSKDKYLRSECQRITAYLSLESKHTSSEDSSTHDFSENSSDDS